MPETRLAVVAYHSGYGHTKKVADHVAKGAQEAGARVVVLDVSKVDEPIEEFANGWDLILAAHGVIFGSPTYMGTVSAPFKTFADASSKPWFSLAWKDKLAAGFTCSSSLSGDKLSTLQYLATLANQQAMLWVGQAELPTGNGIDDINRIGSYTGLMVQADNVSPEESPKGGDLVTAEKFGARFVYTLNRLSF